MNELIKIENKDGIETVNARELWTALESKRQYADWVKDRLDGFIDGTDFTVHKFVNGKATQIDHYITIDTAKHLAMLEKNENGRQIRQYFIDVEKKAKELVNKPIDTLDMLAAQIEFMRQIRDRQNESEKRLDSHEEKVKVIEAKLTTRNEDMFSIAGYAALFGIKVTTAQAGQLGRKATKRCNLYNVPVGKTYDPRFGTVGIYHKDILEAIFNESGFILE